MSEIDKWKRVKVPHGDGDSEVYERREGQVAYRVDALLADAAVMGADAYLEAEWKAFHDTNSFVRPACVVDQQTIFDACGEAARIWIEPVGDLSSDQGREIARTVIQTIIDRTPSHRTVDELTRILRQADASGQ